MHPLFLSSISTGPVHLGGKANQPRLQSWHLSTPDVRLYVYCGMFKVRSGIWVGEEVVDSGGGGSAVCQFR